MFDPSIFKNPQNYGPYVELTTSGTQTIYTNSITDIGVLNSHFAGLLNIMRDGIESDLIKYHKIHIIFTDNVDVDLSFPDTFINIIMWTLYVSLTISLMIQCIKSNTLMNFQCICAIHSI